MNERALNLAKVNAERNGINKYNDLSERRIICCHSRWICCNFNKSSNSGGKETVFNFYDGAFSKLRAGGELWVVIQKKQGAPSTINYLTDLFGAVDTVVKKKGYYILRSYEKS